MVRCSASRPKRRTQSGRGKSTGYKKGMRGHAWEKVIVDDVCIGRKCNKCNKTILNPRAKE